MSQTTRRTHPDDRRRTHHASRRHVPTGGARTIRWRSRVKWFGLPLWEIARGPDPARGEKRGHARAILAVGDVADGVVALGGVARGVIAVGGISIGVCSLGGVSVGLAAAVGGVALAPLALGGIAVGLLALGGAGCDLHGRLHGDAHPILQSLLAWNPGFLK